MSELNSSRRRLLAGIGAVSLASTGIVIGTHGSYFSRSERPDDDGITTGSLALTVDWQERYSNRSEEEMDAAGDVELTAGDPENVSEGYVGLPDPTDPVIAVPAENLDAFQAATAVEAFPDFDDDGVRDAGSVDPPYVPCRDGARRAEDLDPRGGRLRSLNDDTFDDERETPLPLVTLDGVEPGDFGELAVSFYLCDDPGRVWLQADNVSVVRNAPAGSGTGVTGDAEPSDIGDLDLARAIRTVWWNESDGDGILDEGRDSVDVIVLLDDSTSLDVAESDTLRNAADLLIDDLLAAGDVRIGGIRFGGDDVIVDSQLGGSFDFGGSGAGEGITPLPPALDIADQHLNAAGRDDAEQVIVVLTDGGPNYRNRVYSAPPVGDAPRNGTFSAGTGDQAYDNGSNDRVTTGELEETELVATRVKSGSGDDSGDPSRIVTVGVGDSKVVADTTFDEFLRDRIASSPVDHHTADFDNLESIVGEVVAGVVGSEHVFRRGTLADDLAALSTGDGIPIDSTPLIGDVETDGGDGSAGVGETRDCFQPSTNHSLGFAWWLPRDVTVDGAADSIRFDLGLHTREC